MTDFPPTLHKHRRRLPVFRSFVTEDSLDESRHVEVTGLSPATDLTELENMLKQFGQVLCLDSYHLASGIVKATYFDSRDALKAKNWLSGIYHARLIEGPPLEEYSDVVQLVNQSNYTTEAIRFVLRLFGEMSMFEVDGTLVTAKYFDLRVAAKAKHALGLATFKASQPPTSPQLLQESSDFCENDFLDNPLSPLPYQAGPLSDVSTVPSPYFSKPRSGGSKEEGTFDEVRKKLFNKKKEDLFSIDLKAVERDEDLRTTVMVKNIPNKYTQLMLLQAFDKHLAGKYDFIYLPIDFKNKCNVGYAFVNFTSHRSILTFSSTFCEKRWEKFNSEKVCALNYARIQGLAALESHFQNSSVMNHEDSKVKPLILKTV